MTCILICFIFDYFQGYGTQFYTEEEYYEGEWYADKRSGWGRMYYRDGTIYEGEWYDDQRNGQGMLRLSKNLPYLFTLHTVMIFDFLNCQGLIPGS